MQKKLNKKLLSLILSMMLIVAMAFCTTACSDSNKENGTSSTETESVKDTEVDAQEEVTTLGEGSTQFSFTVVEKDGNKTVFEIHTDKTIVGDALMELDLIAGEESEYGLFVKSVNGITADYDVDGTYWAFYVNDEYATAGVDTTSITDGDSYSFKVEK